MTTRIYLVRHGATLLAAENAFAGQTDVALSEEGREQARKLAARLSGEPIAAFYASPMGRTMETARILAAPHGLEILPRDGLREVSHGHWEGRKRAEVERLFPEEYARWEADPFSTAPAGGESGLAVTARALPVLIQIAEENAGRQALLVSHKATIRLLVSTLLGSDPRAYRDRLDQSPASLNILDFKDPTHARLSLFNDTSHYAPSGSATPGMPASHLSKWWDPPERG
ncbi:MAG TPA: histidine phosphatase family protein [Thermoanaerobaculia bacterium]|nr:histidine phosphatase family protein [Thermoanaerobaculia bacterium]